MSKEILFNILKDHLGHNIKLTYCVDKNGEYHDYEGELQKDILNFNIGYINVVCEKCNKILITKFNPDHYNLYGMMSKINKHCKLNFIQDIIYPIEFKLVDICTAEKDSYELKLYVKKDQIEEIENELYNEDFIMELISNWTVSAGHDRDKRSWYIKGCMDTQKHKGKKHHYNESEGKSMNETKFNDELRILYPEIETKKYIGKFNCEDRIMTIEKNI